MEKTASSDEAREDMRYADADIYLLVERIKSRNRWQRKAALIYMRFLQLEAIIEAFIDNIRYNRIVGGKIARAEKLDN